MNAWLQNQLLLSSSKMLLPCPADSLPSGCRLATPDIIPGARARMERRNGRRIEICITYSCMCTSIMCYITRGYTVWNETRFPVKTERTSCSVCQPLTPLFYLTCNTIFGICQFSLSRSILFPPLLLPTGLLSNIAFPTTSLCANLTYKLSICHSTRQYGKSSLRCNVEGKE